MDQPPPNRWPLAPLALLTALVPVIAVHGAWLVSLANAYIPQCNPYVEGCTSISAAGRHGLANYLFKAFMLPYATLLGLFWLACHRWLRELGDPTGPALRWMPWLGVIAAVFLVLYATFLGSEGDFYRLLRRYGVIVFFAFNFLAQILLTKRLYALERSHMPALPRWVPRAKLALCSLTLLLGLANVAGGALLVDNDAFENVIEWNVALVMTLFFLVTWVAWRRTDYRL